MADDPAAICSHTVDLVGRGSNLTIYHHPILDGGGSHLASPFVQLLRSERRQLGTVFEFCSGPGYIAFALLASGLAQNIVLGDVNPVAVACARKTVRLNPWLRSRVRVHLSNGTHGLPLSERGRFDTVVTDWPNYERFVGPFHTFFAEEHGELRGEDPGWRLHREFYGGIRPFLARGGRLYIEEVRPMDRLVYNCVIRATDGVWVPYKEPCDERTAAPMPAFERMMGEGGLQLLESLPFVDERSRLVPRDRRGGLEHAMSWILVVGARTATARPSRRPRSPGALGGARALVPFLVETPRESEPSLMRLAMERQERARYERRRRHRWEL